MSTPNVFLAMTPEELKENVAQMISYIINNHIRAGALGVGGTVELKPDEVFINAHLVDRAGALLNATLASGGYCLDAIEWTVELDKIGRKKQGWD
jgi:hypothetical protein